jgi:hypothetical protein
MAEGFIGLAEPSTITKSLRTVTADINSSTVHQEVTTLGGANSSLELARVQATAPASTSMGLVVRIAGGPSSAADLVGRMNQGLGNSSAADRWLTGSMPNSTLWASSAGFHFDSSGALKVDLSGSASTAITVNRMVGNSSAVDFMPVRIVDSSGSGFAQLGTDYTDGSTTSTLVAPGLTYNNGSNATMRLVGTLQPFPVQLRTGTLTYQSTTLVITSTNSTAVYSLVSSAAVAVKVFAVHVTSTHTTASTIVFMSSLASDIWGGMFGSGSSGVSGFNYAVTPPAFLFKTAVNEALNVRIENPSTASNSTTVARFSYSYFTE